MSVVFGDGPMEDHFFVEVAVGPRQPRRPSLFGKHKPKGNSAYLNCNQSYMLDEERGKATVG